MENLPSTTTLRNAGDVYDLSVRATSDVPERAMSLDWPDLVTKNSSKWAIYGGNCYVACDETTEALPTGVFTVQYSNNIGHHLRKEDIIVDGLLDLEDSIASTVLAEVDKFWGKRDHFKKLGFVWKRGFLLYGPPGSGKTSVVQMIIQDFTHRGGVAIFMSDPSVIVTIVRMLRAVEPDRPIVVIMEDLDDIVKNYGESQLLALMDGEMQIDNVLFIATTNYPDQLDKRITHRPSRFDAVYKVDMPSETARRSFLTQKYPAIVDRPKDLDEWVKKTAGMSLAHLKELIISVEVFENDVQTTIDRLRTMSGNNKYSTDELAHKVGFN